MSTDHRLKPVKVSAWPRGAAQRSSFDHPVHCLAVIETHISVVVLTGQFAYKIKKPIRLPFLDFRSIADRHFYLHEELRLNRRTAPDVYVDVVAVTGSPEHPRFGGAGEPFDHALKMRQFPELDLLQSLAEHGLLERTHAAKLGRAVATFHARLASAPQSSPYAGPGAVRHDIDGNFNILQPWARRQEDVALSRGVEHLRAWTERWVSDKASVLTARKREGAVRECHGDLHLGNIVVLDGEPTAFDCIEFDESLRWIDVANEIAFTSMDFEAHERVDLANVFVNEYLQQTGDYGALQVLPGFMVYRALVRAKVGVLRSEQSSDVRSVCTSAADYIRLARRIVDRPPSPQIVLTHGYSGSGKSWLASRVASVIGAIQIRSDVERRRTPGAEGYDEASIELTYDRLETLTEQVLHAGYPVIVDATFLHRAQRDRFVALGSRADVGVVILRALAPVAVLEERISRRNRAGGDPSEADVEVLRMQVRTSKSLTEPEERCSVVVDTSAEVDPYVVADQLRRVGSSGASLGLQHAHGVPQEP